MIQEIQTPSTHLAHKAMVELRTNIGPEIAFADHVDKVMRPEGYRIVGFFVKEDLYAAAVAGFRVLNHLAWGHTLYCDDIGTRYDHRKHGFAGQLMDWMIEEARRLHCDEFHLDSGLGPDRADAHRLYFNKRMRISSHHFSRQA
ncbi:MAG TPA: GNAT family N-acetyltransferase [Candidatus Dormibacteraeota bacterium]|nr:GNAT family N-acetyltransferase [Candidatus Dormibacteraeota bacterium]